MIQEHPVAEVAESMPRRLLSLDVYRGLTMLLLMAEGRECLRPSFV
ncbi:hypothetical protein [Mucisphaera sp.]